MRRFFLLAIFAPTLLWAWGRDGHRLITRLAVLHLPSDMPAFFTSSAAQLEMLSLAPDEWRDRDESTLAPTLLKDRDPDHFFSWDWYAPATLPPDVYSYADAIRAANRELPRMGTLPYAAMEAFQRMRSDFRQWRKTDADLTLSATDPSAGDPKTLANQKRFLEARIIADAGMIAHYIGDGSQPLHVTENYNGWKAAGNPRKYTTDTTLHRRFESDYVAARVKDSEVEPVLAPLQKGPMGMGTIYAHLERAHKQVNHLYDLEKATPFNPDNQNQEAHKLVVDRLADGASVLRDMWYSAYLTATVSPRPPATTQPKTTTPAATTQPPSH